MTGNKKIALVHYWLTGMRGGEKVVESICNVYPDIDIFTLVYNKDKISDKINSHKITTSFIPVSYTHLIKCFDRYNQAGQSCCIYSDLQDLWNNHRTDSGRISIISDSEYLVFKNK